MHEKRHLGLLEVPSFAWMSAALLPLDFRAVAAAVAAAAGGEGGGRDVVTLTHLHVEAYLACWE